MNTDRGQISGSYDDGSGGCLACSSERGHQVAVVARTCRQLEKMIKMLTLAKRKIVTALRRTKKGVVFGRLQD